MENALFFQMLDFLRRRQIRPRPNLSCLAAGLLVIVATFGQSARAAPSAFLDWVVFPPGGVQAWSARAPLVLTVSMGAAPATHLLARSTLTEERSNQLFGGGVLTVCSKPYLADCGPVEEIAAGQPVQLYLHPKYPPGPGKYTGTVQLFAAEGRSEPAPVTVYVTGWVWKLWGVIALLLGLAASLTLTVGVRNALQRSQLLAPAASLEEAFAELEARLPSQSDRVEQTRETIRGWRDHFSTRQLEAVGFVPRRFAMLTPTDEKTAGYQDWLKRGAAAASALERLLGGFQALTAAERSLPYEADGMLRGAVEAAWSDIDALSASARFDQPNAAVASEVEAAIACVLTQLRRRIGAPAAGLLTPPVRRRSEQLRFQISTYSLATWAFVALVTFVVGAYGLVLARPEFGRAPDYLVAFLWAFGLPSAAAQLAQLSPKALAISLGLAKPSLG